MFRCATSTSIIVPDDTEEMPTPPNVSETRPVSWNEHRYMEFSRSSAAVPGHPLGQTEADADSERWRGDAARAAARLHREDLHLARINSAIFQITNDVLSSSMADVHLRAEAVLRSEERAPSQPTDDAGLNRLYRAMWAMEVLLDESADQPENESDSEESESEAYDDLCVWERQRLAAIHRMFIGSEVTSQMIVVPTSVDHWPTGVSYTPSLVNADDPHIGPVYAGPDSYDTCSYCDVHVMDEMGAVLFDGDLLCQIFQNSV